MNWQSSTVPDKVQVIVTSPAVAVSPMSVTVGNSNPSGTRPSQEERSRPVAVRDTRKTDDHFILPHKGSEKTQGFNARNRIISSAKAKIVINPA